MLPPPLRLPVRAGGSPGRTRRISLVLGSWGSGCASSTPPGTAGLGEAAEPGLPRGEHLLRARRWAPDRQWIQGGVGLGSVPGAGDFAGSGVRRRIRRCAGAGRPHWGRVWNWAPAPRWAQVRRWAQQEAGCGRRRFPWAPGAPWSVPLRQLNKRMLLHCPMA